MISNTLILWSHICLNPLLHHGFCGVFFLGEEGIIAMAQGHPNAQRFDGSNRHRLVRLCSSCPRTGVWRSTQPKNCESWWFYSLIIIPQMNMTSLPWVSWVGGWKMSFHNEKVGYVQGATVNFLEGKRCKWVEAAETVLAVEIDGWLRWSPGTSHLVSG